MSDQSSGEIMQKSVPAIPFELMVKRMNQRRYLKVVSVDYANNGGELFNADLFAKDLGVSKSFLEDIGLVRYEDKTGWRLAKQPDCETMADKWNDIADQRENKLYRWAEIHGHEIEIERHGVPDTSQEVQGR